MTLPIEESIILTLDKDKFKIISLNMLKDKHRELIKWVYAEASNREMSVSGFCISILKQYKENIDDKNRNNI